MKLSNLIKQEEEKLRNEILPMADTDIRDGKWMIEQDEAISFLTASLTRTVKADRSRIADFLNELGEEQGWTVETLADVMRIVYDEAADIKNLLA